MSIDHYVEVNVFDGVPAVPGRSFGTPLLATPAASLQGGFTERTRSYRTPGDVSDDDDLSTAVKAVLILWLSQNPRVPLVKVGRVGADVAQSVTFTAAGTWSHVTPDTASATINDITATYNAEESDTPSDIGAGLRAALTTELDGEPFAVTGSGADAIVTATVAGDAFTYDAEVSSAAGTLTAALTAANNSIADELDAILAADADWYVLHPYSRARLQILRAAAWVEANGRQHWPQTEDADVPTTADDCVASELAGLNYDRTVLGYHPTAAAQAFVWALLAKVFQPSPDVRSADSTLITLSGVTAQNYSASASGILEGKRTTFYTNFRGYPVNSNTYTSSGKYPDVILTRDWVKARTEEGIAKLLVETANRREKIPYNPDGISRLTAVVRSVLGLGERAGHFNAGRTRVTVPDFADIPDADKAGRIVRIGFEAELAGAVRQVVVTGFVVLELSNLPA